METESPQQIFVHSWKKKNSSDFTCIKYSDSLWCWISTHCELTDPPQLLLPIHSLLDYSRRGMDEEKQCGGREKYEQEAGTSIMSPAHTALTHLACLTTVLLPTMSVWLTDSLSLPTCAALPTYLQHFPVVPCGLGRPHVPRRAPVPALLQVLSNDLALSSPPVFLDRWTLPVTLF